MGKAAGVERGEKIFVIAWRRKEIIGICEVRRGHGNERYNINFGISVEKRHRGKGIGRKLLLRAIAEGKRAFKPRTIFLVYQEGNERARKLYDEIGFVEVARLPNFVYHYGKFVDRVIMILPRK
jgi:L-amino acid N-acyltransferase